MRIWVTVADVKNGRLGSSAACPVALALERETGVPWYVAWLNDDEGALLAIPRDCNNRPAVPLTGSVKEWVDAYDNGKKVKPFAFNFPD